MGSLAVKVTANDGTTSVFDDFAILVEQAGETFVGTAGPDSHIGTTLADTLNGLGGNDTLYGSSGSDTLSGGPASTA